ncbi:hypothetical protein [Hydrogenibacillus sp. N12]|nr:hypothetical protein [Hydrogenibacillus sp. N12]QZA33275.1 hypothetical protein K2M58_01555 [Hydrogenibacillus sp. N12]
MIFVSSRLNSSHPFSNGFFLVSSDFPLRIRPMIGPDRRLEEKAGRPSAGAAPTACRRRTDDFNHNAKKTQNPAAGRNEATPNLVQIE